MKKILMFLVALLLSYATYAGPPMTGNYSIPADFTFRQAIDTLNASGVGTGGVTFNVQIGYTETLVGGPLRLTATGTVSNRIIFRKSGDGVNPKITAYTGTKTPGSPNQDGIWAFIGSDYVTIDGIDLYDPNTTNPATMEYGFALFKASASNGCQNDSIKNCFITLSRVNNASGNTGTVGPSFEGSKGIMVINATDIADTIALTINSTSGTNSYNIFITNTIQMRTKGQNHGHSTGAYCQGKSKRVKSFRFN